MTSVATKPLFEGSDWNFDTIQRIYDTVEDVACKELALDTYPNQIEVITAEQMLDAYSSTGMPLFYHHWSFGKQFVVNEMMYRKGMRGLAYELVINSNPCISYIMEENSATMQTLVIAHAAFGHELEDLETSVDGRPDERVTLVAHHRLVATRLVLVRRRIGGHDLPFPKIGADVHPLALGALLFLCIRPWPPKRSQPLYRSTSPCAFSCEIAGWRGTYRTV